MKNPDPSKHFIVSLTKSIFRMLGFAFLLTDFEIGCYTLIFSEIIGVFEELV